MIEPRLGGLRDAAAARQSMRDLRACDRSSHLASNLRLRYVQDATQPGLNLSILGRDTVQVGIRAPALGIMLDIPIGNLPINCFEYLTLSLLHLLYY